MSGSNSSRRSQTRSLPSGNQDHRHAAGAKRAFAAAPSAFGRRRAVDRVGCRNVRQPADRPGARPDLGLNRFIVKQSLQVVEVELLQLSQEIIALLSRQLVPPIQQMSLSGPRQARGPSGLDVLARG
ncbi:MAG TPA: hypothetical protein VMV10_04765 [Pirellulales bacterium]|nr:hypothetical protein [Pirellulales bacterium]